MDRETDTIPPGRTYKSRKERPCDGCRKRKVACEMPHGPPCSRCRKLHHSCQFIEEPSKRKRRLAAETPDHGTSVSPSFTDFIGGLVGPEGAPDRAAEPLWSDLWPTSTDFDMLAHGYRSDQNEVLTLNDALDMAQTGLSGGGNALEPTSVSSNQFPHLTPLHNQTFPGNDTSTLESLTGAFSFYIGPTGTSDISLLSRSSDTRQIAPGLSFRDVSGESKDNSATFGVTEHRLIDNIGPRPSHAEIEKAWAELWAVMDRKTALQLCRLYFMFVNPYFPVLSSDTCPQDIESLSHFGIAILSGICATAIPFMLYDEELYDILPQPPSAPELYRLCWFGINCELHAPTLATVQACLLLQHHMPANPVLSDTAFKWSLASVTLASAQTIGLHRNSLGWRLVPLKERELRQRIWWAVWTMNEWIGLARGMPSQINDEDTDVVPLGLLQCDDDVLLLDHTVNHFESLVQLTSILDDIRRTYYTVKGGSRTSHDLGHSLHSAKPLRVRLRDWQENLPKNLRSWMTSKVSASDAVTQSSTYLRRLDGNASLHLSYVVVHTMLFRALLRPVRYIKSSPRLSEVDDRETFEGVSAIVKGSIFCARELVDFLENLHESRWNAFWHCWSRANFAMAGSFMVDLLLTISTSIQADLLDPDHCQREDHGLTHNGVSPFQNELEELQHLIERWRWISRISTNGAAGVKGLTNLGLFKVETILSELRKT